MTEMRSPARSRAALLLVCASVFGAFGWLWWTSVHSSKTNFLPRQSRAEWIVSAVSPEIAPRPRVNVETDFKRTFTLQTKPAHAGIQVAGFHEYSLKVNGIAPTQSTRRGRDWKRPEEFDVATLLHAGENEISVRVANTNGPAALWLALTADDFRLNSDESWKASCAGAEWMAARLATRPKRIVSGGPLAGGEEPWASFGARWLSLVIFAVISTIVYWLAVRYGESRSGSDSAAPNWKIEVIPLLVLGGFWVALFVNNVGALPLQGFDVEGHLAYVTYILDRHALPLANEGWEMFQPPLYYAACAGVLKILGLHTWQDEAITALRIFGMLIGMAQFVIVWACLRLLFPENRARQLFGAVLTASLPALLYLSQNITNEVAAATLVSASVYLTLRILRSKRASWGLWAGLGICLGAALLTKITTAMVLPVAVVALLWKGIAQTEASIWSRFLGLGFALVICAVVCGWHYARVWAHFHNSPTLAWIPTSELEWWQDDGYRTSAFYLRFGQSLVHPWFSGFSGFPDGVYSTLWGDGLFGGSGDFLLRPPWNYDFMAISCWLALLPAAGIVIGVAMGVFLFIRWPAPEWFLLLGLGFLAGLAVVHLTTTVPYCSVVKAFYGFPALAPLCVFGALGLDFLFRRSGRLRPLICIILGIWVMTVFASFCISGSSTATALAQARTLAKAGRAGEAVQVLTTALQSNPQSAELHRVLAEILLPFDQGQDAFNHAQLAVNEDPTDGENHLVLATALVRQNQIAEATVEARKALELAPGSTPAATRLAALLTQQESYGEAERVARKGLALSPYNSELRLQLAAALISRHELAEGTNQLHIAMELRPAMRDASQPSAADESAALDREPSEVRAMLELAAALLGRGDIVEAIEQYRAALKVVPRSELAHCGLGQALSKEGKADEAAKQFEEALRVHPDYVPALLQFGVLHARQRNVDEAAKLLSEAVRLQPDNPLAHNYLGNALSQQSHAEEAAAQFEMALRLKPDFALAHNNLAITCKKLGRNADAISHYQAAIQLEPNFLEPLNNLAWTLATAPDASLRNGREAVVLAARACELTRYQKPLPLATMAAACAETGRFGDALVFAERAQQLSGGQGPVATIAVGMLEDFRANRPHRAN